MSDAEQSHGSENSPAPSVSSNGGGDKTSSSFVLIRNIPKSFRSSDLRRFFTDFVESGKIDCFHFRHRSEVKKSSEDNDGEGGQQDAVRNSRCCLARFDSDHAADFVTRYSGRHWTDPQGVEISSRCVAVRVKISDDGGGEEKTDDEVQKGLLSRGDLSTMSELRPPAAMPNGNVGTPTAYFLEPIAQCRLPARIIGKLKLEFPRMRRKRKYGSVPFEYAKLDRKGRRKTGETNEKKSTASSTSDSSSSEQARVGSFLSHDQQEAKDRAGPSTSAAKDESGSDDDDDTCEEWERHEALNDDVQARRAGNLGDDISQQPGTKERLFEEEVEVTWDKGSSGLVFYTDAQLWREAEGDFDARTTDDWDVDMSVYYDKDGGAGDMDARDSLEARKSIFRRTNKLQESVFRDDDHKTAARSAPSSSKIGKFEAHTKGFGRKIMEDQGWRDGQGLGQPGRSGIADALENEGQTSRSGLGYYGEAMAPTFKTPLAAAAVPKKPNQRKRESIRDVIISTAYDNPDEVDPDEVADRINPQIYLKHRKT